MAKSGGEYVNIGHGKRGKANGNGGPAERQMAWDKKTQGKGRRTAATAI